MLKLQYMCISSSLLLPSGTTLTCYKDEAAFSAESPLEKYNMQGAEVSPDVDVTKNKFAINVAFPSSSADDAIRLILEDVSHPLYVLLLTVIVDNHFVVVVVICAVCNVIIVDCCVFLMLLFIFTCCGCCELCCTYLMLQYS